MYLLMDSTVAAIDSKMAENGFEQANCSGIYLKDGVHVYINSHSQGKIAVRVQMLEDAQDENSDVVAYDNGMVFYRLFASDDEIAGDIVEQAEHLINTVN